MKKWLIIQFKQIGDVILTSHMPREIHKIYPEAQIDFLTFSMNKPLLINNPHISEIITLDKRQSIPATIKSVRDIRNRHYDVIIDTQNTPRSMYHVLFSKAEFKAGYTESKRRFVYNRTASRFSDYIANAKLNLLRLFKPESFKGEFDPRGEVFFKQSDMESLVNKLQSTGFDIEKPFVTISPTHKNIVRRWEFEKYMDTAVWLAEKGFQIMLTYGPGEKEYISGGLDKYGWKGSGIFTAPEVTLLEFAALLSRAEIHIGNDSAPHHLAVSQCMPTFIVIGTVATDCVHPASMHSYIKLDIPDRPDRASDETPPCLKEITSDMVKKRLEEFMKTIAAL